MQSIDVAVPLGGTTACPRVDGALGAIDRPEGCLDARCMPGPSLLQSARFGRVDPASNPNQRICGYTNYSVLFDRGVEKLHDLSGEDVVVVSGNHVASLGLAHEGVGNEPLQFFGALR